MYHSKWEEESIWRERLEELIWREGLDQSIWREGLDQFVVANVSIVSALKFPQKGEGGSAHLSIPSKIFAVETG